MSFHTRINLDFFSLNLKKNEIQEKIWFFKFKGLRQFKRNFIRSTYFLLRDVSFNRNFKVIKRIFGLKMPNVKDSKQSLPYQISNYPSGEKHLQKGQILNYLP